MIEKIFKVEKLFTLKSIKNMLSKSDFIENGCYPVCSSDTRNNGIIGYCNNPEFIVDKENPVFVTFGDHTRTLNIMQQSFSVIDNTKVLRPKIHNINALLYITTVWKKQIKNLGYARHWKIAKDCELSLPILCNEYNEPIIDSTEEYHKDGFIPDIKYMEKYIKYLENERLKELTLYLKLSELQNYHLTKNELLAIERFKNNEFKLKKFKIKELFDIHPTKSYGLTNNKLFCSKGNTPVVGNSSIGNGISGYVNLPPTEKGNIITYSDTTTDNAIFYQPNDFIGYSHVQGFYPLGKKIWTQNALLFFLTLFKKSAKGRFDYATKFNRILASEMVISLPTKNNGEIDFEFMEIYISAMKKLTIKNVIDWCDKKIKS